MSVVMLFLDAVLIVPVGMVTRSLAKLAAAGLSEQSTPSHFHIPGLNAWEIKFGITLCRVGIDDVEGELARFGFKR